MRIDIFKKAILRRSSIELDGRRYDISKGAWATYVPSLEIKIFHSVDSKVHCVHKSAPDRHDLLAHGRGLKNGNYNIEEWADAFNKSVFLRAAENFVAAKALSEAGLGPQVRGLVLILDYRAPYNKSGSINCGIIVDNLLDYPSKKEATIEDLNACGILPDKIKSCLRQQINGYISDLNSVVGVMPTGRDDEVREAQRALFKKYEELTKYPSVFSKSDSSSWQTQSAAKKHAARFLNRLIYARKRQRKWWRFRQLRGSINSRGSLDGFKWAAERVGFSWPEQAIFQRWVAQLDASLTTEQSEVRADRHQELLATSRALPSEALKTQAWLDLYRLCVGLGLFIVGLEIRNKAIECALNAAAKPQATLTTLERGLAAAIDCGAWKEAAETIERMAAAGHDGMLCAQAHWLVDILAGRGNRGFIPFGKNRDGQIEDQFKKSVEGKTVALVGAAASKVPQGQHIDSHDLVVKLNYRGGNVGRDKNTQGGRVDISYFGIALAQEFAKQSSYESVLNGLEFAVFIKNKAQRALNTQAGNQRILLSPNWMLLDTEFNAGTNAAFDLLRFSPKQLRIFNTDLMLSASRAAGYHPASLPPVDYLRSFVKTHDPVTQYRLFHHAWSAKLIVGDASFTRVMDMGLDGYLRELQNVHGHYIQG